MIRAVIFLIAGPVFILASVAHIIIRLKMRNNLGDLDEYYWEFEDQHPDYARYQKYSTISFIAAAVSALAIFLAAFI